VDFLPRETNLRLSLYKRKRLLENEIIKAFLKNEDLFYKHGNNNNYYKNHISNPVNNLLKNWKKMAKLFKSFNLPFDSRNILLSFKLKYGNNSEVHDAINNVSEEVVEVSDSFFELIIKLFFFFKMKVRMKIFLKIKD
jgi:hypothetical protein